jgi:hypothetical protein
VCFLSNPELAFVCRYAAGSTFVFVCCDNLIVLRQQMGNKQSLEEQVFNIRFTAKQLSKQHDKLMQQEKKDRLNVKKAVEAGDKERARIYAETAIRNKNQALNLVCWCLVIARDGWMVMSIIRSD